MTRSVAVGIGAVCILTATLAVGCASGRSSAPRAQPRAGLPVVLSPPHVDRPRLNGSELKGGAALISGNRIAFTTSGSSNCYWTPSRVTIRTRHAVRIDMKMAQYGSACLLNLVSFPIAVAIGRGFIDVHSPVIVRLDYETHYSGESLKRWHRRLVARPARKS